MKIKTWNAHSINDGLYYKATMTAGAYSAAPVTAVMVERVGRFPKFGAVRRPERLLEFDVVILDNSQVETLAEQLLGWLDADDETPRKLIIEDDGGGNDRYVMAVCEAVDNTGSIKKRVYHVTLKVDSDPLWRSETSATDSWNITATGQTKVLANAGKTDAYPILQIKPTSAKTGGYAYKSFIRVLWRGEAGATNYPVDICGDGYDTETLVTAGKMQADGDDLRVLVDGVEVDRWLDGINTTTTKVWVNLNWQTAVTATLGTACASAGEITTIDASTDISGYPSSGILMIDSEVFTYTGKSNSAMQFTGVTRAAKGTSMAEHTTTDTIYWLQHEIYILYGNGSATAPSVDASKEPMFEMASSTNTSWDYDAMYDGTYPSRPGAWIRYDVSKTYGGNQGATVTSGEFGELGVKTNTTTEGRWQIYNLCGITAANFQNGEKHSDELAKWSTNSGIYSSIDGNTWTLEDTIAVPSTVNTWESWSDNESLTTGSKYVRLLVDKTDNLNGGIYQYIEAADVTLTINSTYTPTVGIGAEEGAYTLDCKITNNTTGYAIELDYQMALNQELEVNTDDKLVTYLADGSNQFQSLTVTGGPRRDWLKLQPGNNTIQFDDTGTNAVTIDFEWEERRYH